MEKSTHSEVPIESSEETSGINVEQAQEDFAQLNRELSSVSQQNGHASREESWKSRKVETQDLEQRSNSEKSEDGWDLERILRGTQALDHESGIKPKRVGVLWENLTVKGIGGMKNIIRTFPDAFVSFFNVPETVCHLFGWDFRGAKKEFRILNGLRGVAKPGEMVIVLGRPGSGCST